MVWNEKQRGDLREKRSIESEYIQNAHSLKLEVIVDRLQKPCWINKKVHSCLDEFRADPKIVLTWLVLWLSLPRSAEDIVDFVRDFTTHVDGIGHVCVYTIFFYTQNRKRTL